MAPSMSSVALEDMRAIVGSGPSENELIRVLHLAKHDVSLAVNLYYDTPLPPVPRKLASSRVSRAPHRESEAVVSRDPHLPSHGGADDVATVRNHLHEKRPDSHLSTVVLQASVDTDATRRPDLSDRMAAGDGAATPHEFVESDRDSGAAVGREDHDVCIVEEPSYEAQLQSRASRDSQNRDLTLPNVPSPNTPQGVSAAIEQKRKRPAQASEQEHRREWLLLQEVHVTCLSTTKGAKLRALEEVIIAFPQRQHETPTIGGGVMARRPWGNKAKAKQGGDILRFSTKNAGEIGRLPVDWARSLIPLVELGMVRVEGQCLYSPPYLHLMDNILLNIKISANRKLFNAAPTPSSNSAGSLSETSTGRPLSTLLHLLGMKPFTKAEFTPEDFYKRKRSLEDQDDAKDPVAILCTRTFAPSTHKRPLNQKKLRTHLQALILPPAKRVQGLEGKPNDDVAVGEEGEGGAAPMSDNEVSRLVGTSDKEHLEEMEPSEDLESCLRPYQKQALGWMYRMEKGGSTGEQSERGAIHPCWEAYRLADAEEKVLYHNVFSGEATFRFPSALTTSRGGILADSMGLGKTVMTISLLCSHRGRGGDLETPVKGAKAGGLGGRQGRRDLKRGGTLIVCPMTLLGQWQTECESHTKPGSLSVYAYYGQDRAKHQQLLTQHDVVITTYGVLASEGKEGHESGLLSLHWHRVVLDEAHTIKAFRSQAAQAVFRLTADCRWCLTGTPIQNQLEDVFSLLHFIRVEPWSDFGWWTKLIQKPHDEGDPRSLKLLQALLAPLMLRRTLETVDRAGNRILTLPPVDTQVIECEQSEEERDFYTALHEKSKVKFNQFVAEGRVLHNYASILELLLRMRQCCNHPFLVLSRSDTDQYSDLDKLAKRFLQKGTAGDGQKPPPSAAFVQGVLSKVAQGGADVGQGDATSAECAVCLDVCEDPVFTPCAHHFCRECLLKSWKSVAGGLCPICRQEVGRGELITAPRSSRFQCDVEGDWKESCKVRALMGYLRDIEGSGEKSVVFSQWTAFLDLLQIPFKRQGIRFVRLDGTMSQPQRVQAIEEFKNKAEVRVMLISLKAGGVGINLTAASHAFIMDPWWNPAVEEQAIMRIHRIGQTRDVHVRRFIVKGTVEEKMQAVQARKQLLVNGALTDQDYKTARLEELKMLFR